MKINKLSKMKNIEKRKILLYMLLLFPFFEPVSLQYLIPSVPVTLIFYFLRTIIGLFFILKYIRVYKMRLSRAVFSIFIFSVIYILVSLVTTIRYDYAFFFLSSIVGIFCFFAIEAEKADGTIIRAGMLLLFILLFINLVCLFVFPNGVYSLFLRSVTSSSGYWSWDEIQRINFLSNDNAMMQFIIPFWCFSIIGYKNHYIRFPALLITLGLITINVVILWSVTSIVGVFILDVMTIMYLLKNKKNLKFSMVMCIVLTLNILIVFLNIQDLAVRIIEGFFEKDLTLTGRTSIWKTSIEMFLSSPLFGYGTRSAGYIANINGVGTATHNAILSILLQGGTMLFCGFSYFVYNCFDHGKNQKSFENQAMLIGLLAYGVICVVETHVLTYGFWCYFALANYFRLSTKLKGV